MTDAGHLLEKLQNYAKEDVYPYHMPGHKRQGWGLLPRECYEIDITEIEGFDNLHQPESILLHLQQKASRLYGAEESFYLVNGSTCGILAAVSCALPFGGHILMARNCHKSAYHAAYLRNLTISYLYPPCLTEYDIFDAVTPGQIQQVLDREPDIGAVLIVSPTYEGRMADIREIAHIVHQRNIPLIVDEAHGAHLGLTENSPPNSCQEGADLVIHSVHKTLPALTQTALLHVSGTLVDRRVLKRFLHIYQTSSPSYLLMASIDNALQYVESEGTEAFRRFGKMYGDMMEALRECRHLRFLPAGQGKQDAGKLLVSVKGTDITGKQLYNILLQEYHLQMEMASESFVLAMFTVNDGEEAYRRMTEALLEIDSGLEEKRTSASAVGWQAVVARIKSAEPGVIPLAAAWDMETEPMFLEDSVGRYAGEFVNLYPPGVPLLVPGEQITEELCQNILGYINQGLNVQGVEIICGEDCRDDFGFTERPKCDTIREKRILLKVLV